jgi:hypothetical protein
MKIITPLFLLILTLVTDVYSESYSSVLDDIRFERISFQNETVITALCKLRDIAATGENAAWYEGNLPMQLDFEPQKAWLKVDLEMENVVLEEVLKKICDQNGITFFLGDNRLIFIDGDPLKKSKKDYPDATGQRR